MRNRLEIYPKDDNQKTRTVVLNGVEVFVSKVEIEGGIDVATTVTLTLPACAVNANLPESFGG